MVTSASLGNVIQNKIYKSRNISVYLSVFLYSGVGFGLGDQNIVLLSWILKLVESYQANFYKFCEMLKKYKINV